MHFDTENLQDMKRPLRIAWIGIVRDGGGVPGMGRVLLEGVLKEGAEVDFYSQEPFNCTAFRESTYSNLRTQIMPSWFSWNRWYSRGKFTSFISSTIARSQAAKKLSQAVILEHTKRDYDCIFQLSQTELFELGKRRADLPPIIVYPCVHAAGELRWHRLESRYARQSERAVLHYITRLFLIFRSFVQRRDLKKASTVIGMSRRFIELIGQDYGIRQDQTSVLYHPIGNVLPPAINSNTSDSVPIRLLYISRISVRKGVEMVVELSRRLSDLKGQVRIDVIGDRTLWSDYTAHLKHLNSEIACYLGQLDNNKVRHLLGNAAGLLLPSHYEPGGLVVGEALNAGVPVVVSSEVGSGEPIDREVCRSFPAGDMDEFERQVRQLIDDVTIRRDELRALATAEADRHFAPDLIAKQLLSICESAARRRRAAPQICSEAVSPKKALIS